MLRGAAQMGDLERVLSWAVGRSFPGCLRAAPSTAEASVADLTNVAERIYHPVASGYSFGCLTQEWADRRRCTITTRLLARLTRPSYGPGEDLFCRCQNDDLTVRAISAQSTLSGGVAHITIGYSHVDLVIARVDGKLLADDLQCGGGGPDTSVYREPLCVEAFDARRHQAWISRR